MWRTTTCHSKKLEPYLPIRTHRSGRVVYIKKTRPVCGKISIGITLKKKHSHADQENPQNFILPIHSDTVAPVRLSGLRSTLEWGRTQQFFQFADKLRLLLPTNPPRRGLNYGGGVQRVHWSSHRL